MKAAVPALFQAAQKVCFQEGASILKTGASFDPIQALGQHHKLCSGLDFGGSVAAAPQGEEAEAGQQDC
eukprot:220857-Rhodomonas_salina.3